MPGIAADLLEAGYDTPALRRLAGEMRITSSDEIEPLVGRAFRELGIRYPISEKQGKLIATRQIAREVIAGKRNGWAAASYLEISVWSWKPENSDLEILFSINDEIDWDSEATLYSHFGIGTHRDVCSPCPINGRRDIELIFICRVIFHHIIS